jgi:hypothetical protein
MSEIDPYNLGPKVYKRDQVITQEDLVNIINELMAKVSGTVLTAAEVERFDAAVATLSNLHEWLKLGKPEYVPPEWGDHNG